MLCAVTGGCVTCATLCDGAGRAALTSAQGSIELTPHLHQDDARACPLSLDHLLVVNGGGLVDIDVGRV